MGSDGKAKATTLAAALIAIAAIALPASSHADHGEADLPWPQLLPPLPSGNVAQGHPVRHCRRADARCAEGLVRRLRRQWKGFDRRCDHRAVIAYSYLKITEGLRDDLARPEPELVEGRKWMRYVIANFSNRYFTAFRHYRKGLRVPPSWRIAFEAMDSGEFNAGQDVLLFSNAHVQHDLPFVYAKMGQRTGSGASRKPDHDAVNAINTRVYDGIQDYIADHYDPSFSLIDLSPSPIEEIATLEGIKGWRELAWRNGERLLAAETPAERRVVAASIRDNATLFARLITALQVPGQRDARDAHCMANHETTARRAES